MFSRSSGIAKTFEAAIGTIVIDAGESVNKAQDLCCKTIALTARGVRSGEVCGGVWDVVTVEKGETCCW